MLCLVRLGIFSIEPFPFIAVCIAKIEYFFITQQDFMSAAINRGTGLNHNVLVAASRIRMLLYLQAADCAPAMQPLGMAAFFAEKKALLIGEVAFHQKFAGKKIISCQLGALTLNAALIVPCVMSIAACHNGFPLSL